MPNLKRGEVAVTLGRGDEAKEYVLVFDMNALAELEELSGMTVPEVFARIAGEGMLGIRFIRAAITAGLQKRYRQMSELRVGELMDPARFGEYGKAVSRGMLAAMGYDVDDDGPREGSSAPGGQTPA